jgi:hypothetical protein
MRVIIIEEKDIQALLAKLELAKFQLTGSQEPEDEIHRKFHYVVVNWLQEQGSTYPHI